MIAGMEILLLFSTFLTSALQPSPGKKSVSFSKRAHCDLPLLWSRFYLFLLLEENVSDASLLFINFKALLSV